MRELSMTGSFMKMELISGTYICVLCAIRGNKKIVSESMSQIMIM